MLSANIDREFYARPEPLGWGADPWRLKMEPATGALVRIQHCSDPQRMNWLREPGKWDGFKWVAETPVQIAPAEAQWGLVETSQTGLLHCAQVRRLSENAWEAVYHSSLLTVTVRRELDADGDLCESYTFISTGVVALDLPLGSVAITAPLFDQYPDARRSLPTRCHAHVWTGGHSAWINAMRMGGEPPHLGLVVTQGGLDAYSQRGGALSERGVFLLHPAAMQLKMGESRTIAWKLFWHTGWDDFFARLHGTAGFARLTAKDYVVTAGQPLEITARAAGSLEHAKVLVNGQPVTVETRGGQLSLTIPTHTPGEVLVELLDDSRRTWLRANVTASDDDLIAARLKFILRRQQRHAAGDPLDGAYLCYDNETDTQVYEASPWDRNAGRERLAMGVLGALYLPHCRDYAFKAELADSLARYATFVARELQDEAGVVYNTVGRLQPERLYNPPWQAHFHVALYDATGDASQLDRFVRVMRSYYARGGATFYPIGLPALAGMKALERAGRAADQAELLAKLRAHADHILKTGPDYPACEVNYEQSIVGPAVQLLAEMYLITGEQKYLDGARQQMPLLEAFSGRQPDHRVHDVSIRHWDDYWFGKLQLYGDTFPHYWSTINATAYAFYGAANGEPAWFARADAVLRANLSLFDREGRGSCAYVYPLTCNGRPGARNDPWSNDQDWALVNLLTVRGLLPHGHRIA
jgi:hypothetical protein